MVCGFDLGTTHAHTVSDQMQIHVESVIKFLGLVAEDSTYLNRVVICDETWVHHYDLFAEQASEHWKRKNEPRQKKVQQQKSAGKAMLVVFFDHQDPFYQQFVPPKITRQEILL